MSGLTPETFIMVIFGATGDLTKRKLIPSLYALFRLKLLPQHFKILAFARRPYSTIEFIQTLTPFISNEMLDEFDSFCSHIEYVRGDFNDAPSFAGLKEVIRKTEDSLGECLSKLYYMAVSPDTLPEIIEQIGKHALHIGCGEENKWTRVIVEKPFGHDLQSAQELTSHLLKYFHEEQIYRIDHYLGKETVQNILTTRFANTLFKPVWCAEYIDHIQITAHEEVGVEDRGGYYDHAGALRDLVQGHLLQILSLLAMREPDLYEASAIRQEKNVVLQALRPLTNETIHSDVVRAQYVSHDPTVKSYTQEEKVSPDSKTETYVALKTFVDLPEWKDVPFYIRTGKKLNKKTTEVHIKFKKADAKVFSNLFCELRSNTLSILLQPDEGIHMRVFIKEPGFTMKLSAVELDYSYREDYTHLPDAYERLLLDAMNGDQSLFTRTDEIESSWKFITNILSLWEKNDVPVLSYEVGTEGPDAAQTLLLRDRRYWINY